MQVIWVKPEAEYFYGTGWTGKLLICPSCAAPRRAATLISHSPLPLDTPPHWLGDTHVEITFSGSAVHSSTSTINGFPMTIRSTPDFILIKIALNPNAMATLAL
jgi:hypothetical protein